MISRREQYTLAQRTAAVAAALAVVIGVMLLADYRTRVAEDPLNSPEFLALKADAQEYPADTQLKEELRELDRQLRETYFNRRSFALWGTWLLTANLIICLVSAKWATVVGRRLPRPQANDSDGDPHEQENKLGRWAVGAFAGLTLLLAIGLYTGFDTNLPTAAELAVTEVAALPGTQPGNAPNPNLDPKSNPPTPNPNPKTVAPVPKPAAPYPSDEELRRNWPRFRGADGSGIASIENPPTNWDVDSGEGILWKTAVPLPGNNSPVVWDNRVFLSGADETNREVFCFDADSGEVLWQTAIPATPESIAEVPEVMEATGFAAPTCATDGRRVYAMFANGDVGAVDFEGKLVWSRSLGIPKNSYGHGASLAMYQDRLIIQFDQGTKSDGLSKLIALQSDTGETVWEVVREVPNSWPTPIVVNVNDQPQIITSAAPYAIAYSPDDGKEIWRAECLEGDVGPSPVVTNGVLFAANEFPGVTAVRADGTGDVTESHVLWEADLGAPDCCSPIAVDDLVYLVASYGILTCYDAKEGGDPLWEQEFDASFVSSPTLVSDLMYLFDEEGKVWIVKPTREQCEIVAERTLGEGCVTSPALVDDRLFIRGSEHLFCIGAKQSSAMEQEPATTGDLAAWPTDEELQNNWHRFRGFEGRGITSATSIPTSWDVESGESIRWKTELDLVGNNSPIVWGDRVFLSGAEEAKREVACFSTESGELLWRQEIPDTPESPSEIPEVMEATGFAAPTCVTDGRRVYAWFANGDVGAIDFEGKVVWTRSLGLPKNSYGHAASLAMYQDRLILQFDQGTKSDGLSKLMALQSDSGETVWEVVREVPNSWPTPIVAKVNDQPQIITCAAPYVIAYSPVDGNEIWRAECLEGDVGPSPVVADGVLFAANEFPGVTAVRADGTGDVTKSHVLWEADLGAPDCCSPIAVDGLVYVVASYGILTCYDAKEGGDPLWEQEFDGSFVSSPTLVGELIYLFDEEGMYWVVKPSREACRIVSEGELGEGCVTSPAFQNERMFLRGKEHLFCIEDVSN